MAERKAIRSAGGAVWTSAHAIFFYAAMGLALAIYLVMFAPLPFVAAWWQPHSMSWDEYHDPLHKRARMADGLRLGGGLAGKTPSQVVALLGEPPPKRSIFSEYDLVYELGNARSPISFDSEWLAVRFGPDGRVSEVDVFED
jgi:hypothetical protein